MEDVVTDKPSGIEVDGVNFSALYRAIEHSYEALAWARTRTRKLVSEFTGPGYGGQGGLDKPLNKMQRLIEAYMMLTASNRPCAHVDSKQYKQFARLFEESVNNLAIEIKLNDTRRQRNLDAFFCIGVVKLHRDKWRIETYGDVTVDPGTPTASNIPLEDWVYDTAAKKWTQIKYCADKYRLPWAVVKAGGESGKFDPEVVNMLQPTSKQGEGSDRIDRISTGEISDDDELEPMVDLFDVWVQQTGKIYTCALQDASRFKPKMILPLGSIYWNDPDGPNHHILGFSDVPHNIMPLAPAANLDVADRTVNNLARKEIRQAERQKEVLVYPPGADKTIGGLTNAPDGGTLQGDAKDIITVRTGGVDQNTHMALLAWDQFFDTQAGNLDLMTGTGASTGTVGQEQILASAGSRKVGDMQGRVANADAALYKSLGRMLWDDELREIVNEMATPFGPVIDTWKPGEREGNFLDYHFDVNVSDLPFNPPRAQLELLISMMTQVFIPGQPMLQAQGGQIDFAEFTEAVADLTNMDVFNDIIRFSAVPEQPEGEGGTTLKPGSTTRNYNRTSVPSSGTPQARLQQTLQGMQQQTAPTGAPQ
jgi:hypothetical protein